MGEMSASSITLLLVVIQACSLLPCGEGTFDLTINVISDSCAGWNCEPGAHVVLSCQFICGDADHVGTPTLREVVGGKSKRLQTTAGPACVGGRLSSSVDYAIPPSSTSGEHTYRCQFPGFNSTRTNVTLTFYGSTPPTDPTTDSGTTDSGTTDSGTAGSGTTDAGTTHSGTTDASTTDSGTTDAGTTDTGTTDSGTTDAGTTDSGTTDASTTDSGTTDAGTTDTGTTDSGRTDAGTTDSGTTDSGTTDSGTTDAGTTDSGTSTTNSGTTHAGRPDVGTMGSGTRDPRDSKDDHKFTGLNPLIYTISAVILLGTLAIVAIITCWIRARRSFHNRQFRPDSTPQDYLDYISDNEFTPLTTSEFLASLEQRPPTYNQSEELEVQLRRDSQSAGGQSEGESETREERSGRSRHSEDSSGRGVTGQMRAARERLRRGRNRSNSDGGGTTIQCVRQRRSSSGSITLPSDSNDSPGEPGDSASGRQPSLSDQPSRSDSGAGERVSKIGDGESDETPVATLIDVEVEINSASDQTPPAVEPNEPLLPLEPLVPIPTLLDFTPPTQDLPPPTLDLATPTLDLATPTLDFFTLTQEQISGIEDAANSVRERIAELSVVESCGQPDVEHSRPTESDVHDRTYQVNSAAHI